MLLTPPYFPEKVLLLVLASREPSRGSHNQGWHRGGASCRAWVTWPMLSKAPELGFMLCAAILKSLTAGPYIFTLHQTALKEPEHSHFLPWLLSLFWPVALRMGGSESTTMNAIKRKMRCTKPSGPKAFMQIDMCLRSPSLLLALILAGRH